MKALVACPACRQQLALSAAMLGQQVQCPACGAHFLTKITKVNKDTQVVPPPPAPPTAGDPAGPVANRGNSQQFARELDTSGAPLKLQGEGGKGKFKKDFTRVVMEEGMEVDKRRRGNDQPATPWYVLLLLPLLLIVPLVLYLCGVFDGGQIRPARPTVPPPIAQAPPVIAQRPPPDPAFQPEGPPAAGNPEGKAGNPPVQVLAAPGPPPATQFAGLVGYWPLELQKDNLEMADASGRGHPLVLRQGSVLKVAGVRGGAVQLRAKTGLDYGGAADFNFPADGGFTLACWVKTAAASGTVVSQRHSRDEGAAINLTVEAGRAVATVRQTGERRFPAAVRSAVLVNDDRWHHCALVRRGNVIELYVDGATMGSATQPGLNGPIATDWRSLGTERRWASENKADLHGVSTYYVGAIDEFCVFNRDLTPAEIRQLAGK
jgi:hypothetical protein